MSAEKKISVKKKRMGKLSLAVMGGLGVHEFVKSSKDDDSVITSSIKSSAIMGAAYMTNPLLLGGAMVAAPVAKGAADIAKFAYDKSQELNKIASASPFQTGHFVETRDSFTMRQVSMAAINQARGNLENAMMGNEASFNHR